MASHAAVPAASFLQDAMQLEGLRLRADPESSWMGRNITPRRQLMQH
jgi:hypothetical protein